jgi:hypothetical protein
VGGRVLGAEICFNALDDNGNGLIDEGCGQPVGPLQIVAAWADRTADIDLLVVDPNLELVEVGAQTKSGLTKDRDCPGEPPACGDANVETVFLAQGTALSGTYRVRLALERRGASSAPLRVRVGVRLGAVARAYEVQFSELGSSQELELTLPE